MRNLVQAGLALGLTLGTGCYLGVDSFDGKDGADGADEAGDGAEGGEDDGGEPQSQCGGDAAPGASPLRRLTAWEYDNTILDLLGDDSHPSANFPQEGGSGFDNNADVATMSQLTAQRYMFAAEEVSARAVEDLTGLMACDPTTDEGCVAQWVEDFGAKAWRRPLDADELAAMTGLFDQARADGEDVPMAVSLVLQAFLQSPYFLYRVELGVPGEQGTGAVRLTGHEMATRLSYMLWGTMPDDALFAAAEAGELSTPEQVEEQARRMLDDAKARRIVAHFHEQWLGTIKLASPDKDETVFPEWSEEIAATQALETLAFVDHVFFEGEGTLEELLTAPYTFVDDSLAEFYGIPAPTGTGLQRVEAPAGMELSGILSQGGVMSVYAHADHNDPIKRGLFVREHLLCQLPPPPPPGISVPEIDDSATVREQFEQHRENPACRACHELFDPIGFGFENYDAVGRWRTEDNGFPVDASGELLQADIEGEFVGAGELGQMLTQSDQVGECVARHWFRFSYGRTESAELDACTMDTLTTRFEESGHDLRELMVNLTQTDAFLYRTAYANEGGE